MTSRLFPVPPKFRFPVRSWSGFRSSKRHLDDTTPLLRPSNRPEIASTPPNDLAVSESLELDTLWSSLVESLSEGVLVVTRTLRPIYTNLKAKNLCQQLSQEEENNASLPSVITEVCHRLIRAGLEDELLVAEHQGNQGHSVRLRVRWLVTGATSSNLTSHEPCILVLLEDCYEALTEDLWIDRRKYDLTDREAEIWMLLRQEYTYQEIANILQISLNTVKTHVKNVYAKRRNVSGQRKIWYSR
jgi:PAS domain-containing protein